MSTKVPGYPPIQPTSAPVTTTVTWDTLTGKPATFPPAVHTHAYADITGKPTIFPPATHTHSYNDLTDKPVIPSATGRLVLLGTGTLTETLLLSLSLGMKRRTVAIAGVALTDSLVVIATSAPTTGCEIVNAYPASAGNVSLGYFVPALGIGASYSIPYAVYRIT